MNVFSPELVEAKGCQLFSNVEAKPSSFSFKLCVIHVIVINVYNGYED